MWCLVGLHGAAGPCSDSQVEEWCVRDLGALQLHCRNIRNVLLGHSMG